jgi:hypothetical protein
MKQILNFALLLVLQSLYAQDSQEHTEMTGSRVVSLGSYNIAIPGEWLQKTESRSNQKMITAFYPSDERGSLKFMSMNFAPNEVTREILRNMTNIDPSISLKWQTWGEFSGYQYDYTEKGASYRQWWLLNQNEILFFVYSSNSQEESEKKLVNRIVGSITAVN